MSYDNTRYFLLYTDFYTVVYLWDIVDNLYSTFIIFQVLQRSCVFGLGASSCARQVFDDIPHFHGAGER